MEGDISGEKYEQIEARNQSDANSFHESIHEVGRVPKCLKKPTLEYVWRQKEFEWSNDHSSSCTCPVTGSQPCFHWPDQWDRLKIIVTQIKDFLRKRIICSYTLSSCAIISTTQNSSQSLHDTKSTLSTRNEEQHESVNYRTQLHRSN